LNGFQPLDRLIVAKNTIFVNASSMHDQFAQSHDLEAKIKENLKKIGYDL